MTMTDSYTMLNYRRRGLCRMGMWTARRGEHDAVVGEKDIDRDSEYENGTGRETHQRKERQRKHQCSMETERDKIRLRPCTCNICASLLIPFA